MLYFAKLMVGFSLCQTNNCSIFKTNQNPRGHIQFAHDQACFFILFCHSRYYLPFPTPGLTFTLKPLVLLLCEGGRH